VYHRAPRRTPQKAREQMLDGLDTTASLLQRALLLPLHLL
jgi:hypothetical protein